MMNDAQIRVINRRFRNKDKATDVLSFSQVEGHEVPRMLGGPVVWGDVLISLESAQAGALAREHTLHEEVARLVVHGVLHLLGHDHVRGGRQARRMALEEARLFALIRTPKAWPPFTGQGCGQGVS